MRQAAALYRLCMPNDLERASRRTGSISGSGSSVWAAAMLERTDDEILVRVPWTGYDSPHAAWFVGADLEPNPFEPRELPPLPDRMLYQDHEGSILLAGCKRNGFQSVWSGPGGGTISARFAVLDVDRDIDFSYPSGLRSDISSLREWLGVRSSKTVVHTRPPEDRGNVTISVKSAHAPEVSIGGGHGLILKPSWRVVHRGDDVVIHESVICETTSANPVSWQDLQGAHLALRDLLVLSRWRKESCMVTFLRHGDDEFVTDRWGQQQRIWRSVVFAGDIAEPLADPPHSHLIRYSDIGHDGILRWLKLREAFARALDPVITSRFMGRGDPMTYLAQVGPGLEALGYLLLLRDGAPTNVRLRKRLDRIASDIGDVLPFDASAWAESTVEAYNGVKHANRAAPAPADIINAWAKSVLVVRAWVAMELGVAPDDIRSRLLNDPHASPFEDA